MVQEGIMSMKQIAEYTNNFRSLLSLDNLHNNNSILITSMDLYYMFARIDFLENILRRNNT